MTAVAARCRPDAECRVAVIQGERHVTQDPDTVLTTILGSCVAACLRDPVAGIGGMNHFLLPGQRAGEATAVSHGVHAMELLVNDLLGLGARRSRLQAKLFGGGRMLKGLTDVGAMNAAFAERFLADEGISYLGGSLRGDRARRIQFWPVSGRARQQLMAADEARVFDAERHRPRAPSDGAAGAVELF